MFQNRIIMCEHGVNLLCVFMRQHVCMRILSRNFCTIKQLLTLNSMHSINQLTACWGEAATWQLNDNISYN